MVSVSCPLNSSASGATARQAAALARAHRATHRAGAGGVGQAAAGLPQPHEGARASAAERGGGDGLRGIPAPQRDPIRQGADPQRAAALRARRDHVAGGPALWMVMLPPLSKFTIVNTAPC